MFESLTLRGPRGALLWGADSAATLGAWVVVRKKRAWSLRATVERVDTYRIKQVPLLFQAHRAHKPIGHWVFPIVPKTVVVNGRSLTATLGPPEGG